MTDLCSMILGESKLSWQAGRYQQAQKNVLSFFANYLKKYELIGMIKSYIGKGNRNC